MTTKTSNSPIDVNFVSAPIDSLLQFDATSSNAPVRASLDKTYEGSFVVHTGPWFPANVFHDAAGEKDPAGMGRSRNVEMRAIGRGTVEGTAVWGDREDKEYGKVVLTTNNSPVALHL